MHVCIRYRVPQSSSFTFIKEYTHTVFELLSMFSYVHQSVKNRISDKCNLLWNSQNFAELQHVDFQSN